ncbi:hypothetical protein ACHAXA_006132 [Cyclostephanos tholiformis]|uniref:Uncharacterized protein n=1 Tax=Cyclostephanos tholiformis TaxID=382380 RepID=A0ABD3RAT4_9STRA
MIPRAGGEERRLPTLVNPACTEEEERIMDECSFFYYSNMDEGTTNRIVRERGHGVYDYSRDVQTRARRMWTERRYRRRLGQTYEARYHRDDHDRGLGMTNDDDDETIHANARRIRLRRRPSDPGGGETSFAHHDLAEEDRRAFVAAHRVLNGDEYYVASSRGGRIGPGYDIEYDLELAERDGKDASTMGDGDGGGSGGERLVYRSSLSLRGGLIRLPADNVRLVCDPWLQPGILSIEARDVPGKNMNGIVGHEGYGNLKYNNVHGDGSSRSVRADPPSSRPTGPSTTSSSHDGEGDKWTKGSRDANLQRRRRHHRRHNRHSSKGRSSRQRGLSYVLTVDMRIYQRVVQEMGDSYRLPCGMYYCCHVTATGGNYVDIGVAVAILSLILILLIAGMIAWGID